MYPVEIPEEVPMIRLTLLLGGIVEEVGPKVTKQWKKGDRIASFTHGGNESEPEDGSSVLPLCSF